MTTHTTVSFVQVMQKEMQYHDGEKKKQKEKMAYNT